MICVNCGNKNAYKTRVIYDEKTKKTREFCNKCGDVEEGGTIPDVYFRKPYFDENLATKESPQGTFITSKRHKAKVMEKLNLREAGGDINKTLGKPQPYFSDVNKRRKYFRDNFGDGG